MTTIDFLSSRMAGPFEQRASVWRAFLDRIIEGRMRQAESQIARYLERSGRKLPVETARQGH